MEGFTSVCRVSQAIEAFNAEAEASHSMAELLRHEEEVAAVCVCGGGRVPTCDCAWTWVGTAARYAARRGCSVEDQRGGCDDAMMRLHHDASGALPAQNTTWSLCTGRHAHCTCCRCCSKMQHCWPRERLQCGESRRR